MNLTKFIIYMSEIMFVLVFNNALNIFIGKRDRKAGMLLFCFLEYRIKF